MNTIEQGLGVDDVPDHEAGSESSIGGIGEPQPASFHRLKGFYQHFIDTPSSFLGLFNQFLTGLNRLEENGDYTRVQHRAIFEGDLLRHYGPSLGQWAEAAVPLDSGHLGTEPVLVYMAANTISRRQNNDDLLNIDINANEAKLVTPRQPAEIFERSRNRGYDIALLSEEERHNDNVVDQVASLYERFGWERTDVGNMLSNPSNILAVARYGGEIVSSGIGEMAVIPLQDTQFRIAELTEAATDSAHENNGCYSAISATLLFELARRSREEGIFGGEIDLVFGESNGLSQGVLCVAANQGRTFSTDTVVRYGLRSPGILRQQVPISGPQRNTEYNDLIVSSLRRSDLYNKY